MITDVDTQLTDDQKVRLNIYLHIDEKIKEFQNKVNLNTMQKVFGHGEGLRLMHHLRDDCNSLISIFKTYLTRNQWHKLLANIEYNDTLYVED